MIADRLGLWTWGVHQAFRLSRPDVAFAFLGGLGDELLCTAPLVEWQARGARNIWVMTSHPALFRGFGGGARILPSDRRYERLCAAWGREFRYLSYSRYDPESDRDLPPDRHLIAEMCARAGLTGPVSLRPHLRLEAAEIAAATRWQGHIVIQSSTLHAHVPMPNKQWPAERFQAVIDRMAGRVPFIQVGSEGDPPLRGVVNLCGQTTLRETAAVLFHARGFLGPVGFLMHLARAVECPAVIIYGGRETPGLTGYACNIHLTRSPACSPCWQRARCDFGRICLEEISAGEAVAAVEMLLSRPRGPLVTATSTI